MNANAEFKNRLCGQFNKLPAVRTVALLLCLAAGQASATTNIVTTLADSSSGSLRDAILNAAPGDTITIAGAGSIYLQQELHVTKNLKVLGPGAANLSLTASGSQHPLLRMDAGVTQMISGVTLSGGHSPDGVDGTVTFNPPSGYYVTPGTPGQPGGAIYNAGTLTMVDCVIQNNSSGRGGNGAGSIPYATSLGANGGAGGAIYNTGVLTLSNCLVSGNTTGAGGTSGPNSSPSGSGGPGGAIYSSGTLCLYNTTIRNSQTGSGASIGLSDSNGGRGGSGGDGGGIWCSGALALTGCNVCSNHCGVGGGGGGGDLSGGPGGNGGSGGGIWCSGTLTLTDCNVSSNYCGPGASGGSGYLGYGGANGSGGYGCGIYSSNKTVLIRCAITSNQGSAGGGGSGAGSCGGGIYAVGNLTLTDSTVSRNSGGPGGNGAGIRAGSYLFLTNCTLAFNSCSNGSAFYSAGGQMINTLLASNTPTNCSGVITDLGHNLSSDGSCHFTNIGSLNNMNPNLGPLADNGGPTLTMALLPGSPAIDAGDNSAAQRTDQRGFPRLVGPAIDIGAYELCYLPVLQISPPQAGAVSILVYGLPNQSCRLLTSGTLANWLPIATNQISTNGMTVFQDGCDMGQTSRFFRVVIP